METLKQAGYTVKDGRQALGISRSGYYALKLPKEETRKTSGLKNAKLLEKIKAIKTDHPFWGYRRVWAWLVHREKMQVNEKKGSEDNERTWTHGHPDSSQGQEETTKK